MFSLCQSSFLEQTIQLWKKKALIPFSFGERVSLEKRLWTCDSPGIGDYKHVLLYLTYRLSSSLSLSLFLYFPLTLPLSLLLSLSFCPLLLVSFFSFPPCPLSFLPSSPSLSPSVLPTFFLSLPPSFLFWKPHSCSTAWLYRSSSLGNSRTEMRMALSCCMAMLFHRSRAVRRGMFWAYE